MVVLPFVPVTATIGTRLGDPGGNSRSITGLAMYCGSPIVGWVCIRKPGAAFTSQIAPPVSRTGSVMSGAMKSIPATSRPTTRAASSAISTLSGWASNVRSMEMPPVDMFPVSASLTITPGVGHGVHGQALGRDERHGRIVDLDPGEHLLVPDAAARVGVGRLDQLGDRALPVADHVRRHPLGDGGDPPADDQEPVVVAGDEALDLQVAAAGLRLGRVEAGLQLGVVGEVEHHAAAVVAVQRLDDHRVADPPGHPQGAAQRAHRVALGHRQPGGAQQLVGEVLVAGDVHGQGEVFEVMVARIRWA